MNVVRDLFELTLPEDSWSDRSTNEGYHDFQLGDKEQVCVSVHVAKKPLLPKELFDAMVMLLKHRLQAAQEHSGNSCHFQEPVVEEVPPGLNVRVVGQDLRANVFMQIGHFGGPDKIVVVCHYDYTGCRTIDEFKARSDEILVTLQVR